jgi:hypothetical protein
MLNDWFSETTIELGWTAFQRLPRHAACRYEYRNERLHISGNPRFYHAVLDLDGIPDARQRTGNDRFRPIQAADWPKLSEVFVDAFSRSEPFVHLKPDVRLVAAATLLEETRHANYGPLVEAASFGLFAEGKLSGAAVVTLIPSGSLSNFSVPDWQAPAPPDAVQERWGQPHLTWIFVASSWQRRGEAGHLLAESAGVLKSLGYSSLASTFLLGDHASMLWHWRMGFELLGYAGKFPGNASES